MTCCNSELEDVGIGSIPTSVCGLSHLTVLSLVTGKLERIPPAIARLSHLETL
jgi:Leucine-rich repeat (LRR) protein